MTVDLGQQKSPIAGENNKITVPFKKFMKNG